jgi:hypothetical protein
MEERSEFAKVEAVGKRRVWSTARAIGMRRFARIAGGWTTVAVGALVSATVSSAAASLPLAPVSLNASGAYNGLQVKPATIVYTGDGTGFLGGANVRDRHSGIHWSKWTADVALGSGFNQLDNCEPSCAGGKFHGYPVKIELWRAQTLAGTLVFTRMTIFYKRGRPPGQPHHYTFTDSYEGAGYGWGPPSGQACTGAYGLKPSADCKNIHSLP